MCGIVGIVGNSPVKERLLLALERLEYRGYDSAGIAFVSEGHMHRFRASGRVANLRELIGCEAHEDGMIGIAHTRWATHGAPSQNNAHPHMAGQTAIIHNGIIENFQALKTELIGEGAVFTTDTDSEVIAHLIQAGIDQGFEPQAAFARVLPRLRGAYALAAIFAEHDDILLCARHGAPMAIGLSQGETFVASDALALSPFSTRIIYLEEGDWALVRRAGPDIYDVRGDRVERPVRALSVGYASIEKGEYDHFMEKEIFEQPAAIQQTLSHLIDPNHQVSNLSDQVLDVLRDAQRIIGLGCGTAFYSAFVAKYWAEPWLKMPFDLDVASEFRYRQPYIGAGDVAMVVSQSGETADSLAALEHCAKAGAKTLGIVNVAESSIARLAQCLVPTAAGPEIGVASTKAFTAQLTAWAVILIASARLRNMMSREQEQGLIQELIGIPRLMVEAMQSRRDIAKMAKDISGARDVLFLGRGVFYPLALEGALKLKEISYIHAEGYAAGEMKHGPIALIDREARTPIIVLAPYDALFEKTYSNLREASARGGHIHLITDQKGADIAQDAADNVVILPDAGPVAQVFLAALAVQLLAYHTAVERGCDVDKPRNLAKAVTVE